MAKFTNIFQKSKKGDNLPKAGDESMAKEITTHEEPPRKEGKININQTKLQIEWQKIINELTTTDIRFYFLKDNYLDKINKMYTEYSEELDKLGISQRKFLDFIRESFERIKQIKKKLPLEPMNDKFYNYVEKCVHDLMEGLRQKFKK
ncbi:MAG: hypothetical protein L6Q54_04950 [Leptospiraceae bacterium]|nr:hypothetical protein [Leptospiraceae bacterium]MCK6380585.1 hypothetical protein [Leptospiraceae bacterium]NUM40334.1 hypothetical protein [Leptospiraceae bacterium]